VQQSRISCGGRVPRTGLRTLASLRGAQVTALDASAALLAIVRQRIPAADVREGDLEALPFGDGTFDAVTAVNSLFYAAALPLRIPARCRNPAHWRQC
jgi:hypothetical protein